jgi:putative FmdB family regulatory protein
MGGPVPTYAYACTACDHRFDIVQSFSDDALTECPQCQGRLRKLFNAVGVVFKGSGFYRTDSRSGSSSSKGGSSTGSGGESSDGGSSTGETKAADKKDAAKPAPAAAAASSSGGSAA